MNIWNEIWNKIIFKFGIIKMNLNAQLIEFRDKRKNLPNESLPVVIDLGGRGKGSVRVVPGFGKVRLLTVNLFDEADISDDAAKLDLIDDESLDGIYSSHLIEHFWWFEVHEVFNNWYKKLKPNSRIEIRTPDFEWAFKKSLASSDAVWEDILLHTTYGAAVEPWHCFYQKDGQYHRNIFFERRLKNEMENAGFRKVRRIRYFFPGLDRWKYDLRYQEEHGKFYVIDLVMEGYKK